MDVKTKKTSAALGMPALGIAAVLLTAASSTGCYKATFVDDASATKKDPTHEEWTDHYAFGVIGNEDYDVRQWCPEGTGMVRTGGNVGTTAVTVVTIGIYAPRKVYVTCESPKMTANNTVTR